MKTGYQRLTGYLPTWFDPFCSRATTTVDIPVSGSSWSELSGFHRRFTNALSANQGEEIFQFPITQILVCGVCNSSAGFQFFDIHNMETGFWYVVDVIEHLLKMSKTRIERLKTGSSFLWTTEHGFWFFHSVNQLVFECTCFICSLLGLHTGFGVDVVACSRYDTTFKARQALKPRKRQNNTNAWKPTPSQSWAIR